MGVQLMKTGDNKHNITIQTFSLHVPSIIFISF